MRKRRFAIAVLLVAAVAVFFLPPVYWRVVGFVKGEAFYDGRPTSWWSAELQKWTSDEPGPNIPGSWTRNVSNWEAFLIRARIMQFDLNLPDFDRNPAAVPVLEGLLRDANPNTRRLAVDALAGIGPAAKAAFPSLMEYRCSLYRDLLAVHGDEPTLVHHRDFVIIQEVSDALIIIDPEAASAAGIEAPK